MTPGTLDVLQRLWALHHGIEVLSAEMTLRLGVSGPQRLALRLLSLRDAATPGELSRALHLHPSSLTGMLRRLEAHGLIVRARDPSDGRRQRLRVTPQGTAMADLEEGTVEAALRRTLGGMGEEQVVHVLDWLTRFANELAAERGRLAPRAPRGA